MSNVSSPNNVSNNDQLLNSITSQSVQLTSSQSLNAQLTNLQLTNSQSSNILSQSAMSSSEQTIFDNEINKLIDEVITYTQNEQKFKSLVGEVLIELKDKVESHAQTRVKAWSDFVETRLKHIMSRSTVDKYIKFHLNYDEICDKWRKLGNHIDDLTVQKGLDLLKKRNKMKVRAGRELEEHVRYLAVLKQQNENYVDDCEPPTKRRRTTAKQKILEIKKTINNNNNNNDKNSNNEKNGNNANDSDNSDYDINNDNTNNSDINNTSNVISNNKIRFQTRDELKKENTKLKEECTKLREENTKLREENTKLRKVERLKNIEEEIELNEDIESM